MGRYPDFVSSVTDGNQSKLGSDIVLGLFFLSCAESLMSCRGLFSSCSVWASRLLWGISFRVQGRMDSAVVVHRFSWPETCRILVPGPGIEPMSPALQLGFFLTTGAPGKPCRRSFKEKSKTN